MPDENPQSIYTLAPLGYFDPAAFTSSDKEEQKVCSFVLTLALVYNDFCDLLWVFDLHLKNPPDPKVPMISTERGHYVGMQLHAMRLIYSLFRETMYLIKGREEVVSSKMFQSIILSLSPEDKKYWAALVDSAMDVNNTATQFNRFLGIIRNKLTFHYVDMEPLIDGYKQHFLGQDSHKLQDAFISRGLSMSENRFYFADAAIEGALKNSREGKDEEYLRQTKEYSQAIGAAIYGVVTHFIQNVRKAAWHEYSGGQ